MIAQLIFQTPKVKWSLLGLITCLFTVHMTLPTTTGGQDIMHRVTPVQAKASPLSMPKATPKMVTSTPTSSAPVIEPSPTPTSQPLELSISSDQPVITATFSLFSHVSLPATATPFATHLPTSTPPALQPVEAAISLVSNIVPETSHEIPATPEPQIQTSGLIRSLGSLQMLDYPAARTRIFSSVRLSYPNGYLYIDDTYTDLLKWPEWDQPTIEKYLQENYGYPTKDGGIGRYYINPQGEFVVVPSQAGPGLISYLSFTPREGKIENLGNIKIWVDGLLVVNEPAAEFLSGYAHQTNGLCQSFSGNWANICYTPLPYRQSIEVAVTGKPDWWHITVTDLPDTAADDITSFDGTFDAPAIETVNNRLTNPAKSSDPSGKLVSFAQDTPIHYQTESQLTIQNMRITVPKFAVNDFYLIVADQQQELINLPLYAFWGFGSDKEITAYQSLLLGVEDRGDSYFFYANMPLPFGEGGGSITLQKNGDPVLASLELVETPLASSLRLKVSYNPKTFLAQGSPDYEINLDGQNIRVLGMMFRVSDFAQELTFVPDWVASYVESNIEVYENLGWGRWQWRGTWAGIEDFSGDANYFQLWNPDSDFLAGQMVSTTPDHKNLTILRIFPGLDGLTGQNGLQLTVEHGAWRADKNNDAQLNYGHTIWYYLQAD